MTPGLNAAHDIMFAAVQAVFDTANLGYVVDVRYPGIKEPLAPPENQVWARVSTQQVTNGQTTLQKPARYTSNGLLYVQIFCPTQPGGLDAGMAVAKNLLSTFRNPANNAVWYRSQDVRQLPPNVDNYPINFVTNYTFDTVE